MKFAIIFLALVVCISAAAPKKQCTAEEMAAYQKFKVTFKKSKHDAALEAKKCLKLQESIAHIKKNNADKKTHESGLTSMSAKTEEEMRAILGYTRPQGSSAETTNSGSAKSRRARQTTVTPPASIDWRLKNAVTPVKNQGNCGSCWAFSTTGVIEGQKAIKTGVLAPLSEQNLVDCSTGYGNAACNGGFMTNAYNYVKAANISGIDTNVSYPYVSGTSGNATTCSFKSANIGAVITGYKQLTANSEAELKLAVGTVGPVAVAIDAGKVSFQNYKGAVYMEPLCNKTHVNHAVLIVGYDTNKTTNVDYWIVKNSWGTNWGDKGYFYIPRNNLALNDCGIKLWPSYVLM